MTNDDNDGALLDAWRAGDGCAGSLLVGRHAASVLRFFRRNVRVGAEDLAQRTFLAAVENRDRVHTSHGFRAYLLGIARHELSRAIRDGARTEATLVSPPQPSPSSALIRREDGARLLSALRRLPRPFQLTLELYYWEEMKTAAIAEALDVATGTIKWRLSKAREMLGDALRARPIRAMRSADDSFDRWMASIQGVVAEP